MRIVLGLGVAVRLLRLVAPRKLAVEAREVPPVEIGNSDGDGEAGDADRVRVPVRRSPVLRKESR